MGDKYFSDVIDYDKHIKGKQLIEVISGIGSGKTSWVRKLADTMIDGHKPSILFITSRKAVANAEVLKYDHSKASRWINLETEYERFGLGIKKQQLAYCTNGGIEAFFRKRYNPDDERTYIWNLFDFIILDEAHSLSTDAVFTSASFVVERFIKYAVYKNPNCHVILMTGTHNPIDWIFNEKTLNDDRYACWDFFEECRHVEPEEVWLDRKHDAFKQMLNHIKSGSRVVYFASSVSRIKDLRDELIEKSIDPSSIGIAFSPSKEHNEMFSPKIIEEKKLLAEYIAVNERLPDDIRVFLSTSQNKEGITISNEDIYYMFAESTSMCDLRQMVGRVRNGKVSNQIKIFHVVYDNPYRSDYNKNEYERVRDRCYLEHLNNGLQSLFEINEKYAWQSIEDIEAAFPNIKYDFLYKKEFILYQGRIEGLEQQYDDNKKLNQYIDEWDFLFGKDDFQEWFPYSAVKLNSVKIEEKKLIKMFRADIKKYLVDHNMLDKPISAEVKDSFTKWLKEYLQDFDCKTAGITIPSGKVLGKKLKQVMGIRIEQHGGHKRSMHVISLVEKK